VHGKRFYKAKFFSPANAYVTVEGSNNISVWNLVEMATKDYDQKPTYKFTNPDTKFHSVDCGHDFDSSENRIVAAGLTSVSSLFPSHFL